MVIKLLPMLQTTYSTPNKAGYHRCPKCASNDFTQIRSFLNVVHFASCKNCGIRVAIMFCSDVGGFLHTEANHFLKNLMFDLCEETELERVTSEIQLHRLVRICAKRIGLSSDASVILTDEVAQLWEQENG